MTMLWAGLALAGGTVVSGALGSGAAKSAAKAQERSAAVANQTARDTFDKQAELQEPFRQAEMAKQSELMRRLGIGGDTGTGNGTYGDLSSGFMPENWMTMQDPGYNFRLEEGMKALDHRLAASGMNASGAGLKAGVRFGQDMASQEYQNAFSRYQTGRNATLNPLMGGSTATAGIAQAAGSMGSTIGENQIGAGNSQAAGYVGGANAWSNAISGGINSFMGLSMLNGGFGSPKYPTGQLPPGSPTNVNAMARAPAMPGVY